jgi:hypothetical protein
MFLFENKKHISECSKSASYSAPLGDGLTIQVGFILSSFLVMMLLFSTVWFSNWCVYCHVVWTDILTRESSEIFNYWFLWNVYDYSLGFMNHLHCYCIIIGVMLRLVSCAFMNHLHCRFVVSSLFVDFIIDTFIWFRNDITP